MNVNTFLTDFDTKRTQFFHCPTIYPPQLNTIIYHLFSPTDMIQFLKGLLDF